MKKQYLTMKEVSERLRCSRNSALTKAKRGDFGEVVNFGKKYLVTESGLDDYIALHTRVPESAGQERRQTNIINIKVGRQRRHRDAPKLGEVLSG